MIQKTLSIIKPDAVERNLQEEIKKNFIENGFNIKHEKNSTLFIPFIFINKLFK